MDQEQIAQVDGDHYAKGKDFQHWDWVSAIGLPYLESCATKYVTRWKGKFGILDLEKSISFIKKLIALFDKEERFPLSQKGERYLFLKFCEMNKLSKQEQTVCWLLSTWESRIELECAITIIEGIIVTAQDATQAQSVQGGASGSGKGYYKALQGNKGGVTGGST